MREILFRGKRLGDGDWAERLTLKLISEINLVNEDDREEIAEEFKAIMEDYFGLEETV